MSKNKIGYVAPPEPKFIREMKAKLGYQYQDNLDTKLRGDAGDFDEREGEEQNWHKLILFSPTLKTLQFWFVFSFVEDQDDEKPTVVVMKDGDLNEEEAKEEEANI